MATLAGGGVAHPGSDHDEADDPYGRFAVVADPFGAAFAVMRPPGS